ncbi:Di-heme cytochrome c peroxidase [Gluconacetobacter diazotrophicus PA1 5]|uniref:Cytochrome-c peroxidase n=2 Tax=Gluconacetobacter diazotrophicus TaxID=33996 RepID=A0A7W4FDE1_GLUDI|nr:cytochrome c peroxidase [Gluconacetobacter diazotrophicus]ACI50513.1 Di-heme cytochrome c peroxidase [Gluconacetobacter diazotrophicus PA1 5]MBB2155706.1 cytochrome-c peroxidase [Gluconacetobacter diazotrophicus]TWB09345.1 cytochrome c peroxidase [Gluconacetobacter diazotrophicus]CAP56419.1 putative cytochrome c peroxidase [Gluconacetobacter diazotrophicus PA1 5]
MPRRSDSGRVWFILLLPVLWLCSPGDRPARAAGGPAPAACQPLSDGRNPCPVALRRPPAAPLSAMALAGRDIFHDPALSGSGRLSCASCHDRARHYGPAGAAMVARGGVDLSRDGLRAVPTLAYLERRPAFSIGPDNAESEAPPPPVATGLPHAAKTAQNNAATAANMVPQGGLFWDGRADTLQQQATGPLFDPREMASSRAVVLARLARAPYTPTLYRLGGPAVARSPDLLLAEALFAVARYQIEDPAFHPYASPFDDWLEGKTRLSPAQRRGYLLFNDPAKGNCAACHPDRPGADGRPPLFTDHQFEALGAPRNRALAANRDPSFHDLGLCGPPRADMAGQSAMCGLFATPTLRNVATRHTFFHNGVFRTLDDVLAFYTFRDVDPGRIYPVGPDGQVRKFDDLPDRYQTNIDVADAPFDRHPGDAPPLTPDERRDIVAFLDMLTDRPAR